LPQLYAARPVQALFDPQGKAEKYQGVRTRYQLLPGGVTGLPEGFVGRRREQQQLLPGLRKGDITFLVLHGFGGHGKRTLASRLVDRLGDPKVVEVRAVLSRRPEGETAASCAARAAADVVKEIALAADLLGEPELARLLDAEDRPLARRLLSAA